MDQITDRPFGLPELITLELDLPFPPSLNRIWRRGRIRGLYLSAEYKKWRRNADVLALAQGICKPGRIIAGPFEAYVKLHRARHGDLDNYGAKAVFDWCQSRELITNDGNCQRLTMEWVDRPNAPEGCRLILREMVSPVTGVTP